MEDIAIIPARGGSKRIPGKNIRSFHGKPMLAYAIAVARDCGLFSQVIVSSDNKTILSMAESLGAFPLRRPTELADDFTPTVPVIAHAINTIEKQTAKICSAACCIYPSVPFLTSEDLVLARQILTSNPSNYVFPIVAFPSPIARALRHQPGGRVDPFFAENAQMRTQDLREAYYDAGQFYWAQRRTWVEQLPVHPNGVGIVVSPWRAIDIDTIEDWERAELLYRALHLKGPSE